MTDTPDPLQAEGTESRWAPYIWPTWLSGLISGDKHCWWSAWFRAHFHYKKRVEENNDMRLWRAKHASAVQSRVAQLIAHDWAVSTEDQNRLNVKGKSATIGGCPDIVAHQTLSSIIRVEDVKTGKQRDSDYWQVLIYMFLLTLAGSQYEGMPIEGGVIYNDSTREILHEDLLKSKQHIVDAIKMVSGATQPQRTPSAAECERCDIACCPDRIVALPAADIQTEEF